MQDMVTFGNLERAIHGSSVDRGFAADLPLGISSWRNASGNILSSGTTPIITIASDEMHIQWATGSDQAIYATIMLPYEFHPMRDVLQLITQFRNPDWSDGGAGDDDLSIVGTCVARSAGAALSSAYSSTASLLKTGGSTAWVQKTFDWSWAGTTNAHRFDPGDAITIKLDPAAHAQDKLDMAGSAILRFVRAAAFYDRDIRDVGIQY